MKIPRYPHLSPVFDQASTRNIKKTQEAPVENKIIPLRGEAAEIKLSRALSPDQINSDDAARKAKVERLKREVSSGEYNPDSTEIAKAFVKEIALA